MLAQKNRLNKRGIDLVYKKGRRWRGSGLSFIGLRQNKGYYRIAIVLPKKIIAKATARNLIKRRIAAAVRKNVPGDFSFDILIRMAAPIMEYNQITEDIQKWLKTY